MPYEIDEKTKHNLLAMSGIPDYDDKGNENRVPPTLAALYERTARRYQRVSGSTLSNEVLCVIVAMAEVLEEMRGAEPIPASSPSDDPDETIIDQWLRKEVKRGDIVVLDWKNQKHEAIILGVKADRSQVKIQIVGDDTARWVTPSWVTRPEPESALA
jgi:hypothetical protein